ncbi:MAG: hypothetical protein ACRC50_03930 [Gaiella sp.]
MAEDGPSDERRRGRSTRARSFVLGGLVGASAVVAGARRRRRRRARRQVGLAAFEGAPCFREATERRAPEHGEGPW